LHEHNKNLNDHNVALQAEHDKLKKSHEHDLMEFHKYNTNLWEKHEQSQTQHEELKKLYEHNLEQINKSHNARFAKSKEDEKQRVNQGIQSIYGSIKEIEKEVAKKKRLELGGLFSSFSTQEVTKYLDDIKKSDPPTFFAKYRYTLMRLWNKTL